MKRYASKYRSLPKSDIIGYSGFDQSRLECLEPLRDGYYRVSKDSVGGDAPKDFIRVYEHGRAFRSSSRAWPAFVAKVGHKWYPNESITEHFLTRLGQAIGVRIADSRLMMAHGQLRFLSRFFLRRRTGDSLVHGAEIFAGHLARQSGNLPQDEMNFVEEVEDKDLSRSFFTFQFVEEAVRSEFPEAAPDILDDFVTLLAFDGLVGNNDRHYFNWGVITDIRGKRTPRLAPIYDTARALFWNTVDGKLEERAKDPPEQRSHFLEKYVKSSFPKTGWDGLEKPTHFELLENISKNTHYQEVMRSLCDVDVESAALNLLDGPEFRDLFSETRKKFVVECLALRRKNFRRSIGC
jgi:hypothetical protein